MRYRILPYKQGSRSAKALAEALGGKVLKLQGSSFKPKEGDLLINWGSTKLSQGLHNFLWEEEQGQRPCEVLNWPGYVQSASNKLTFFQLCEGKGLTPSFWTDPEEIPDEAFPIVCRSVLAGHSGAGISIASSPDLLVACQLYVQYLKKKDEYRVHLGRRGEDIVEIAVQRKAKSSTAENVNWQIRNKANGFIYKRNQVLPPAAVQEKARRAFELTGLDFGAVDVIWNETKGEAYVLEINTAPGLEGQTVEDYASFFRGST